MGRFRLETARLRLREWADADQPAFERLATAPEFGQFADDDEPVTHAENFIARMRRNQREMGWALWAVEILEPGPDDPSGPIGWAGFGTEMLPVPELAWTILPSVWRRGYATEAATATRDYGFGVLGMDRIVSVVDRRNIASARVAAKVGMQRADTIECHGVEHDLFEMDEELWRSARHRQSG